MKIGLLGTGKLGSTLGKIWAEKGHIIMFGSRDPQKAKKLANSIGFDASGGTYEEVAKFGDVIILAVPWSGAKESIKMAGDLVGKIIVDSTTTAAPHLGGPLKAHAPSAAAKVAKWAVGAKVIKAVHTIGVESLNKLQFGSQQASLFICGDYLDAKSKVKQLGLDLGFDVIDAGSLTNARLIEPLAMLWIELAYKQGMGTDIAFKLLRRRKAK
ncbi:MAG: NAD(P)-binding domain-containing protein [Candidatus Lokiarchaeota archaeon]|nr:NAD(P)-binding domain-containing protein [Candidatus Lokiarchaeota archaeon]